MSMFNQLKSNFNTNFDKMRERVAEGQREGGDREPNFEIGVDPSNNGYARVRLMPMLDGISLVSYVKYTLKRGSKSYNAWSRRTIGEADPANDLRGALWRANRDDRKDIAKKEIRVCRIYVYEDKVRPENNGKFFRFYLPYAISEKITEAITPKEDPYADAPPMPFDPFNLLAGRDLIIRVSDKQGQRSYVNSHFAKEETPWLSSEAEMEKQWEEHIGSKPPLSDMLKPENFKSYEELMKMLVEVWGYDSIAQEVFGAKFEELGIDPTSRRSSAGSAQRSEERKADPKKEEPKASSEKSSAESAPADEDNPVVDTGGADEFSDFDFGED